MTPYWLFIASSVGLQKHYTQIEKETLSIVFGVKRFPKYLYGCRFIVINCHKPWKSIFNGSIIFYSPAKDILISDTLSRFHLSHFKPEFTENSLIHHVHFILLNLPISGTRLKEFQLKTKSDPILSTLFTYTNHE